MSDAPANDMNDLLLQRQLTDEARSTQVVDEPVETPVEEPDPVNRNLAMQLAIQQNPGASMNQLEAAANQFYSYLTQHN